MPRLSRHELEDACLVTAIGAEGYVSLRRWGSLDCLGCLVTIDQKARYASALLWFSGTSAAPLVV